MTPTSTARVGRGTGVWAHTAGAPATSHAAASAIAPYPVAFVIDAAFLSMSRARAPVPVRDSPGVGEPALLVPEAE
jgi:hypothetical protein